MPESTGGSQVGERWLAHRLDTLTQGGLTPWGNPPFAIAGELCETSFLKSVSGSLKASSWQ